MSIRYPRVISATIAALAVAVALAVFPAPPVHAQNDGDGTLGDPFGGPTPIAPKFTESPRATRTVPENAAPGDPIGAPITATHENNLAITYSLSGPSAASFAIDGETGQLMVKEGVTFGMGDTFTLTMLATDSAGSAALITVVIEVVEAAYHPYDANGNETIERDEVFAAVRDYFAGAITKREVIEVIQMYYET